MKCTVLGAGAWGTTFGQVMADAGNDVTMWAIEPEIVEGIRDRHHNAVRLPSVAKLPDNMTATGDRAQAVKDADIIVVAIAAQFARVALAEFKDLIPDTAVVVSLMKGIERNTKKRMDEVVREALDLPAERFAAVSGPNLSKEIADRLHISLPTVNTHRKNICEKLGVKSVPALTVYAVMHGYVELRQIEGKG